MNTTTKNRTRRLVAASILALAATVGTSTAHAADVRSFGLGVRRSHGRRGDLHERLIPPPQRHPADRHVSSGWEFGQNVAWRYTIVNVATNVTLGRHLVEDGAHVHRVVLL